jgi:hypothetical protein
MTDGDSTLEKLIENQKKLTDLLQINLEMIIDELERIENGTD